MRNRSSAMAITNNAKKKMSQEIGLQEAMNEEERKEKITIYIENKLRNENRQIDKKTFNAEYYIDLPTPQYLDIKKEYQSKGGKPTLFHDRANVIKDLKKSQIGDIESYAQNVDFRKFLAQFSDEEEVNTLEIQDLLNLDYEKLGELKERANEYVEVSSQLLQDDPRGDEDLLVFFCEKLNDIKRNEINIQVFINNVEKVESLTYSRNKTQVSFKD